MTNWSVDGREAGREVCPRAVMAQSVMTAVMIPFVTTFIKFLA
jgi:hypothetical protein